MKKISKVLWTLLATLVLFCLGATFASAQTAERADVYYAKPSLEGNVAYVYERLEQELLCYTPKTEISLDENRGVTKEELSLGVKMFLNDHPECFWVSSGYRYSVYEDGTVVKVTLEFVVDEADIPLMRAQLDSVADSIIASMPDGDNYAKALYLHDALASHTEYVETGLHQTAYGALVSGKAVCAGYASAYQLLLQRVGICSFKVSGSSIRPTSGIPEPHAWNLVMIEDGVCVYTDVTWDDQGEQLYREYFCRSLEEFLLTHAEDKSIYDLPDCSHAGYGYFERNNKTFNDADGAQALAKLFYADGDNRRTAKFCYLGEDVNDLMSRMSPELYSLLGGKGGYQHLTSRLGQEIHITISGDFSGAQDTPAMPDEPDIPSFETNPDAEVPSAPATEDSTEVATEAATEGSPEGSPEGATDNKHPADDDYSHDKNSGSKKTLTEYFGCKMSVSAFSIVLPCVLALAIACKKKKE